MAKYPMGFWARYDIGDIRTATNAELIRAVERAAKAANNRMRSLEKAGFTSGMYAHAVAAMSGRKRFRESVKKLNRTQLQYEYAALRSFMSASTSTPEGVRRANKKRFETAKARGFTGTEEEFYDMVERFFTKRVEQLYSSNVIYDAITSGKTDLIDAVLQEETAKTPGEALLEYLARK